MIRNRVCLAFLAFTLLRTPALAAPPPEPVKDPAVERLKAILNLPLGFKTYVFHGDDFPACDFTKPEDAKKLLGDYSVRATFYDREFKPVENASTPGLYAAIVEVKQKEGTPIRRHFTLFRSAEKFDPAWRFKADTSGELAKALGLDAAKVGPQTPMIAEALKERPAGEFVNDMRTAKLFAGLSQVTGTALLRKNADAFALDRQYWVTLKRKLNGTDKAFAKPFERPAIMDGKPGRVVHEGTLAEAGMKADAAEKIDEVLSDWAPKDDQAFAVCIVRHGVIVLNKAYGTRDGKPMTLHTKSWMASITKTMSASMMWMLIDQGLVDLDDPVEKYVPALRDIKVETPLTIRHLYTHTNGFRDWPGWHDDLTDVEERIALYYPRLKVGKDWQYNGTGYILGGKVIEAVTGEAVPMAFQKHLLDPLGCPDTDVFGTHADAQSVPLDIAKFGQMILNGGSYGGHRFFREETLEKMVPQKLTMILGADAQKTFGIGLDGSKERLGHGAASAATFTVDRKNDLVVIMTRNKQGKVQDKYNGKFWDAIKAGMVTK